MGICGVWLSAAEAGRLLRARYFTCITLEMILAARACGLLPQRPNGSSVGVKLPDRAFIDRRALVIGVPAPPFHTHRSTESKGESHIQPSKPRGVPPFHRPSSGCIQRGIPVPPRKFVRDYRSSPPSHWDCRTLIGASHPGDQLGASQRCIAKPRILQLVKGCMRTWLDGDRAIDWGF